MLDEIFNEKDLKRITQAVQKAEAKTSGEIVPYYVPASDDYPEATYRGAALLGGALICPGLIFNIFAPPAYVLSASLVTLTGVAGIMLGFLLVRVSASLKRTLAGGAIMERRVTARALDAFVSQEVFNTRERTGILLFISVFEHRVLVLGDTGINQKVEPGDWDGIIKLIVNGIRQKKATEGLVAAIEQCEALLEKAGVERRHDDSNELPDGLRRGQ